MDDLGLGAPVLRHLPRRRVSGDDPDTVHGVALPVAIARLARSPIAALPSSPAPDVLGTFVRRRTRGWGSVAVPLSPALTVALWILFVFDLAFGGWLLAVRGSAVACSGPVCGVATLGNHVVLTLVLAAVSAGALLVLTSSTRGFSRASGPEIAVLILAALCGVVALAGVAALVLFAALCLVVAFGMFVVVVDRI